jgi:hypothetical protein
MFVHVLSYWFRTAGTLRVGLLQPTLYRSCQNKTVRNEMKIFTANKNNNNNINNHYYYYYYCCTKVAYFIKLWF